MPSPAKSYLHILRRSIRWKVEDPGLPVSKGKRPIPLSAPEAERNGSPMSRAKLGACLLGCSFGSWLAGFLMAVAMYAPLAVAEEGKQLSPYSPDHPVPPWKLSIADPDPGEQK
jgi:hypothetical protein